MYLFFVTIKYFVIIIFFFLKLQTIRHRRGMFTGEKRGLYVIAMYMNHSRRFVISSWNNSWRWALSDNTDHYVRFDINEMISS